MRTPFLSRFFIVCIITLLLLSANCKSADEEAPNADLSFEEQAFHALLFNLGVLGPQGISWNAAATIEQCGGTTVETLSSCETTLSSGQESLREPFPRNVNISMLVTGTALSGRIVLVAPQFNSAYYAYDINVTGTYQPGAEYQTNIITLNQVSTTAGLGEASGYNLTLTEFRAEERPTGLKGEFSVNITSSFLPGVGILNYSFDSEKVL